MKELWDALIIGGGIAGVSVGERLMAHGLKKVLILEKEPMPATGSTGCSAGGIRQQFGDEAKVRAALYSYSVFIDFEARYGVDPAFLQHGYLILRKSAEGAAALKEDAALQQKAGLPTQYLEPGEISEIVPALETGDMAGATFNPTDGYLDPHAVVQGFMKAYQKMGGKISFGVRALDLLMEEGKVLGAVTTAGEIRARKTIVASGPQTNALLAPAGLRLPMRTCRRQIFSTGPVEGIFPDWPLVLDVDGPFYFRPETGGVIMSLAEVDEMDPPMEGNEIPLSRKNLPELAEIASHRCPLLAEGEIRSGWAGLRTITPDERPLLGPMPGLIDLFVMAGFSGHGITLSPFASEFLAREITDKPIDKSLREPFLLSRLQDNFFS